MILIIAEKPKAAKKIAESLGQVRTQKSGDSYYYEVGGDIAVAPAVGHVYGLVQGREGWDYPIFDVVWQPNYKKKGFEYTKSYIQNLRGLGKQASEIIIATDYDVEGSVIGFNVLKHAIGKTNLKKIKRMKFSTLTPQELLRAFKASHPHNQFEVGMVEAGLLRHHMDWFWGINLSRALTQAYKTTGAFKVLSTGRVQGPTLKVLVEREKEIKKFDSKYFFRILANIDKYQAEGPEFDKLKPALDVFLKLKSPGNVVNVQKNIRVIDPPPPFNLTDLQTESNRVLKFTPKVTLELAQKLYEDGIISYPRTSSQKLPKELDTNEILEKLSKTYPFAKDLKNKKYRPGKKDDPAHPAIYPTGVTPGKRDGSELKIYDLVARRFMASFSEPATRESTKIILDVSGVDFILLGRKTIKLGFTKIYPAGLEEKEVPKVKKGDKLIISSFELKREQKRPPKRYTAAGLLKLMEKLNLGTKATRANIIQTLYDRGYIEGKSIKVLTLGEAVVDSLENAAPEIVSIDLTREFEEKMQEVHEGKRKRDDVLNESKEDLKKILERFKQKESEVGKTLSSAIVSGDLPKAKKPKGGKSIGTCECGQTVYSLKSQNDKKYAKCFSCGKSWGLPQRGTITVTKNTCKKCKLFMLEIKRKDAQFKLCPEHGFG
ncbi:MAG: DNA topoisomerase I [Candidatus Altiarchaeota archaeon]|nr:DNA topoisomerase I [Candidatus Altiarchaeota archaeon]